MSLIFEIISGTINCNFEPRIIGHYFTVTGLIEDNVKKITMMKVSTWGREYYLNYYEYIEYIEKENEF